MNNYNTFITNFTLNLNTFYISYKYNLFFSKKTNKIINWNYIGRIKLPEKFIIKYNKKIKNIILYDYSEKFIENVLINLNITIDKKTDYSIFKNYNEKTMIVLFKNGEKLKIDFEELCSKYSFSYEFYERYNFSEEDFDNTFRRTFYNHVLKTCNIDKFTPMQIENIILNELKLGDEPFESLKGRQALEIIRLIIEKKKINKKLRMHLIQNHQIGRVDFYFHEDLVKFQYLSPQEIEIIKKQIILSKHTYTGKKILNLIEND